MANHKDAIKRIRQTEKRRLHNRYYAKNMRNEIKKFRTVTTPRTCVTKSRNSGL